MKQYITLVFLLSSLLALSQKKYMLSENSKLEIDGSSTIHDWTVVAKIMKGTLETRKEKPTVVNLEVKVAGIKSERGAVMDKKTHNALKIETSPEVTFAMQKVDDTSIMQGVLSMAGKTKTIEVPTKIINTGKTIQITGSYPITLQDWDIEPPSAMFGQIVVGNDVTVRFDLVFSE